MSFNFETFTDSLRAPAQFGSKPVKLQVVDSFGKQLRVEYKEDSTGTYLGQNVELVIKRDHESGQIVLVIVGGSLNEVMIESSRNLSDWEPYRLVDLSISGNEFPLPVDDPKAPKFYRLKHSE